MHLYAHTRYDLIRLSKLVMQEFCKGITDPGINDKFLLKTLFKAVNVYFNYTGSSNCVDVSQQDSGSLGDQGWNVQVCTVKRTSTPKFLFN